jgi:multisubunit Na+/H+ antiporter MnhG subunit
VALCIVAGIGLGHLPGLFARIAAAEVARSISSSRC